MANNFGPRPDPSFFLSLFDFSFTHFIAAQVVKLLYLLWMILVNLIALVYVIGLFVGPGLGGYGGFYGYGNGFVGFLAYVFGLIFYLMALILGRIFLEFVVAVFRIEEHLREQRNQNKASSSPGPAS